MAEYESSLRPFPEAVRKPGLTREFLEHYRRAFDADPESMFSAGEYGDIVIVIARGVRGEQLRDFVLYDLEGLIQTITPRAKNSQKDEDASA